MRGLFRVFDALFRFFGRLIFTPILLGWMIGSIVATPFIFAFFDQQPGESAWPILQDMSQLKDLYGDRANTFIANAGVQQVFGVNDFETAKWLSQMIGQETSRFQTDSFKPGDASSFSNNLTGRDLLTPDEIMQMPPDLQLLRVQGQPSALAQKLRYYADREFAGLFVPQTH